jgi:hypothetical protein
MDNSHLTRGVKPKSRRMFAVKVVLYLKCNDAGYFPDHQINLMKAYADQKQLKVMGSFVDFRNSTTGLDKLVDVLERRLADGVVILAENRGRRPEDCRLVSYDGKRAKLGPICLEAASPWKVKLGVARDPRHAMLRNVGPWDTFS